MKEEFQLIQWWGFSPTNCRYFLVWSVNWKINCSQISAAETVFHSSSSKCLTTAGIANSKTCERKACMATQCAWSSSCLRRASSIEAGVVGVSFWRLFFSNGLQIFDRVEFFLSFLDLRVIICKSAMFKCGYCILKKLFWRLLNNESTLQKVLEQ